MSFHWYDLAGTVGVVLIVGSYLLAQLDRLAADGLLYPAVNAAGASLVLLSLAYEFNFSAVLVEGFWLVISLVGLGRRWWLGRGIRPEVVIGSEPSKRILGREEP